MLLYGAFDPRRERLTYANAGHPPPILRWRDGSTQAPPSTGRVGLRVVAGARFEERPLELTRDEFPYVFTDGVSEAPNAAGEKSGSERLNAAVTASGAGSVRESARALIRTVGDIAGDAEQTDDLSCLVLRAGRSPEMARTLSLVLENDGRELGRLAGAVDDFTQRNELPAEDWFQVRL